MKSINISLLLAVLSAPCVAQQPPGPQLAVGKANLELRIVPSELRKGLPNRFEFVFVNVSDHSVRMPTPTQCNGENGKVFLQSHLRPLNTRGVPSGGGGGCVSGDYVGRQPGILKWVESWKLLLPGESLAVSYSRRDLFNFQEDAGTYDFWGEYLPPKLAAQDVVVLERAGFDFPRAPLASAHLRFNRPN